MSAYIARLIRCTQHSPLSCRMHQMLTLMHTPCVQFGAYISCSSWWTHVEELILVHTFCVYLGANDAHCDRFADKKCFVLLDVFSQRDQPPHDAMITCFRYRCGPCLSQVLCWWKHLAFKIYFVPVWRSDKIMDHGRKLHPPAFNTESIGKIPINPYNNKMMNMLLSQWGLLSPFASFLLPKSSSHRWPHLFIYVHRPEWHTSLTGRRITDVILSTSYIFIAHLGLQCI